MRMLEPVREVGRASKKKIVKIMWTSGFILCESTFNKYDQIKLHVTRMGITRK
jgi:hypothetical protein